jgi:hypothetical protein
MRASKRLIEADKRALKKLREKCSKLTIREKRTAVKKMLNFRGSLDFACPICKVQPQEKCELLTGAKRFHSHVERINLAQDHNREIALTERLLLTQ